MVREKIEKNQLQFPIGKSEKRSVTYSTVTAGPSVTKKFHFVKMERVLAEINFIKIAMDSFTIYQDENERTAFLDSEILKICDQTLRFQLTVYVEMTKDKLDELLDDLLLELQKEKVIKLGSSAGNRCFMIF